MQALGWLLGGLVGGLTFSSRMFVVVGGLPAMVPSIVTAVLVFLLACLVLRRMQKEVEGVGARKCRKPEPLQQQEQSEEQQQLLQLGGGGSGRDALARARTPLTSPDTAARRNNNHSDKHPITSSFPFPSSLPPSLPPPPPPPTFLQAAGGDYAKAHAHYHAHLRWRAEERVKDILNRPHPNFDAIKQYYPHFVHGRGKQGEIVVYEFPGKMDLRELKKQGVGAEEIGMHYVYFNEFLSRMLSGKGSCEELEGRKNGGGGEDEVRVMTVLDIGGLGLGSLSKDVLEVIGTTSRLLNQHYPSRVVRIVVVNVPFFVGGAWKVLSSVLPQQVQDKIELSSNPEMDLLKYIDRQYIPKEYGGVSREGLGESEEEEWLRTVVRERGRTGGREGGGTEGEGVVAAPLSSSSSIATFLQSARTPLPSSIVTKTTTSSSRTSNSSRATTSSTNRSSSNRWLPSWMITAPSYLPLRNRPSPIHAHLGLDNKFVFDQARGVWVLREEEEGEEGGDGEDTALLPGEKEGRGREEEEEEMPPLPETEEDGLILAIQAAHYAEQLSREGKKSPPSFPFISSSSPSAVLVSHGLQHHSGRQQQTSWKDNATNTNTAAADAAVAAALGEMVGPVVGAWVLSWSVAAAGVGVTYPMDARLIWHVSALLLVGLYVMTLQLQVVLKGDWGAMRLEEGGAGGGGGGSGFIFLGKGGFKKGRKKKGRRSGV
ncbi:sec14 cytosolic [Nannochloropsis oceanica]